MQSHSKATTTINGSGSGKKELYTTKDSFQDPTSERLAGAAGGKDAVSLLGVCAAVVDVVVRETSVPHHNTTEGSVVLVLGDEGGKVGGSKVVLGTRSSTGGTVLRGRDTDDNLSAGRRSVGNVGDPVREVGASVSGAALVVVELNPEVVELAVGDDVLHVRLGNRALRSTGDVVGVGRVAGEVATELLDQVLVVVVTAVGLNVEVPAVHESVTEWARSAATALLSVRVPERLADGLGIRLALERVGTRGTTKGEDDLLAVALAGGDGRGEVIAASTLTRAVDGARLADGTSGGSNTVTPLVEEGKDKDVDTRVSTAVAGEVVVLNSATTVLTPVDNSLSAGSTVLAAAERVLGDGRVGHGSGGQEAETSNRGEMHFRYRCQDRIF